MTCAASNVIWMDLSRYNTTYCMIVNHFWPVYTYLATWPQCDQTCPKASRLVKTGKNLSYLATGTYIGPLWATLDQIRSILPHRAISAITWFLRPNFLISASTRIKSIMLHILDHTWSSLTKWGHTGSLDAVLCSVWHTLASKLIRSNSDSILPNWPDWSAVRQIWLWMDIPCYNRTYCIILEYFSPVYLYFASSSQCDQTGPKASKLFQTVNAGTSMARIYHI